VLLGDIRKIKIRGRGKHTRYSWFEYICSLLKTLLNPLTILTKSYVNFLVDFKPPNRLNNLFNPNMNNVEAIDFESHAHTVDTDGVVSRWTCEFPRLSSRFKSKADVDAKPWGSKSDPVYIDLWQDSNLLMLQQSQGKSSVF
jgi:hypothetical protein